jgi:hypothetical protein
MGLLVTVYYNDDYRACAKDGASTWAESVCVMNVDGPFEPDERHPAYVLTRNYYGSPVLVPQDQPEGLIGPMAGGNFAGSSDSRFNQAVSEMAGFNFYGAIPIHDRYETQREYDLLAS